MGITAARRQRLHICIKRCAAPAARPGLPSPTAMFPNKPVEPAVNRKWPRPSEAQRKKASQIEQVSFISWLAEVSPSGVKRLKV
jgi:hypothetical protein